MRWLLIFLLSFGLTKGFAFNIIHPLFDEVPKNSSHEEPVREEPVQEDPICETNISLLETPDQQGGTVEIFIQSPNTGPGPLLIFFHGASSGVGLRGLSQCWCDHWLKKGYSIAAISLPGYSRSTGVKDFCGPNTMKIVNYAVDQIKASLGADDFGVIGFGQGSLAGALLAIQRDDVLCVVSANGGYNFISHLYPNDPLIKTLQEKDYDLNFQDTEALKNRSLLHQVDSIEAPFFLLHRDGNPIIPVQEVSEFASAMWKIGNECLLSIFQRSDDQRISCEEVIAITEKWVDDQMHSNTSRR